MLEPVWRELTLKRMKVTIWQIPGCRVFKVEDPHLPLPMCPGDKENRSYHNGEAYPIPSCTMPSESLENLKRNSQGLTVEMTASLEVSRL